MARKPTKPTKPAKAVNPSKLTQLQRIAAARAAGNTAEVQALIADQAIAIGQQPGPAELHAGFAAIMLANERFLANDEAGCRDALAQIGLQSPFLEWKLALRGLQAYAAGDDQRAVDNFSRLRTDRAASLTVAPLRARIDPAYRAALSERRRSVMDAQASELLDPEWAESIRTMTNWWRSPDGLAASFVHFGKLPLPPVVRQRLLDFLVAMAITKGSPAQLEQLRKGFNVPADDPAFQRAAALQAEEHASLSQLVKAWTRYADAVPKLFPDWPTAQHTRARALIMDRLAGLAFEEGTQPNQLGNKPTKGERERAAKAARETSDEALALAPDRKSAWELRLKIEDAFGTPVQQKAHAERFLERFPDSELALVLLADLARQRSEHAAAVGYLERAVKVNPLDHTLRLALVNARRSDAQALVLAGKHDQAGAVYQKLLANGIADSATTFAALDAALYYLVTDNPAERERVLALAIPRLYHPVATDLTQLALAHLWKLKPAQRKPFETAVTAALAAPPDPLVAMALIQAIADAQELKRDYRGSKTHATKVRQAADRSAKLVMTDAHRQQFCQFAEILGWTTTADHLATAGQAQFPGQIFYPLRLARLLLTDKRGARIWQVQPLIERARTLFSQLPAGEQPKIKPMLQEVEKLYRESSPMVMFSQIFGDGAEDFL